MRRDDGTEKMVGYKNPPVAHRFKKGTSGNLIGRPKGSSNTVAAINAVLNKKVRLVIDGKTVSIPAKELFFSQTMRNAIKGSPGALKAMLALIQIADRGMAEEAAKKPSVTIVLQGADARA